VKRSGCAALPLGLAFAEALHFRLKFQRKLRPFPALCKEEAPNSGSLIFSAACVNPFSPSRHVSIRSSKISIPSLMSAMISPLVS
jgi:hypothetical protein